MPGAPLTGAGRGEWRTSAGFILAAAGSAIGLGNIWRFPFLAGQNGGSAFLIVYTAIVFTIGISLMLAELAIGRAAARNPVGAFAKLKGGAWPVVGFLGVLAGFVILSYYSVVGGWTIAYAVRAAGGALATTDPAALGSIFTHLIGDPVEPLAWHLVFMALTIGIVVGGVNAGIERWNRILLPALFVILIVLVVRAVTLDGAGRGLAFYLKPDFDRIGIGTIRDALAQAFFSLSLGMGTMITYGSYLARRENLLRAAGSVTGLDFLVAFCGGLIVLPAVFAFGYDPGAGPGLTFITLPAVFAHMPAGELFAVLFFALLGIAALTSAISMLEVVVAYFVDEWRMTRRTASLVCGAVIFVLGIPASLSFGALAGVTIGGKTMFDAMDYLASNLLLPLVSIGVALFVGWVMGDRAVEELTNRGTIGFPAARAWRLACRFVGPAAIAWVLLSGL